MADDRYQIIHEYMQEILYISNEEEFRTVTEKYETLISFEDKESIFHRIWEDSVNLGTVLMRFRSGKASAPRQNRAAELTDREKAELAETEGIINSNRFDYHFQPIVKASDGEIYSYEALMRPRSDMKLSPFHIIKYADIADRMNDIELATFLNVLTIIDSHKSLFYGRKVFINSIPSARLSAIDLLRIDDLLRVHSDTAVVEMTEQTEYDESHLDEMTERYGSMNIRIAIDDYGTGYSNIRNLLRYDPDYVKIDRSLLSGIEDSPQKRHFVREIIDFCHDNDILALAEGVETEDELRTVILLGTDLIQGYYTARPSADVIESIPYEIKQQIIHFRREMQDGLDHHIYYAEESEHIRLDKLAKYDYTGIVAGRDTNTGDIRVTGVQSLNTDIHIEVTRGFSGTITLENANLSNVKGRPCIDIGEESRVTLILKGENTLSKGGIRVPESSELTVSGNGLMRIRLNAPEYYGIGNDLESRHGKITFEQDNALIFDASGQKGICIGSGMGGDITITRGQYILDINSDVAVGIGSFYRTSSLYIYNCDFSTDISVTKGTAIGSLDYSTNVHITKSSTKLYLSGREIAGIGNLRGDKADIRIDNANVLLNITADCGTAAGALNGSTDFSVENATFRLAGSGEKLYIIGGVTKDTSVSVTNADTSVKIMTQAKPEDYIPRDRIKIVGGRPYFMINNYEVELNAQ